MDLSITFGVFNIHYEIIKEANLLMRSIITYQRPQPNRVVRHYTLECRRLRK